MTGANDDTQKRLVVRGAALRIADPRCAIGRIPGPHAAMTEQMINVATVMAAGLILLLVYFVWLAAHRRKNWPRWALAAALVLSIISLVQIIGDSGLQLDSGIEI